MDLIRIEPIDESHIDGFRHAVGVVARKRKYLASVEGFPREATRAFVRSILSGEGVSFIAAEGSLLVGWCDIVRPPYDGLRHSGRLGMGVLPSYRGRGLGHRLLGAAVSAAPSIGITRIELEVFASNEVARRLYERAGFAVEGVKRRARILDDVVDDIVCMALLLD